MTPRYVEDQPDTVPTDHGDLGPSKAEYREAAEAATSLGADAQRSDEGAGVGRWGFVCLAVALAILAAAMVATR